MPLLTGLLLFFFPDKLVGIFSADAAVIALGASASKNQRVLWPALSAAGTIVAGALRDPATGSGPSISVLGMWAASVTSGLPPHLCL